MKDLRFPKEARLHHRSLVEGLYRLGKSFYVFPFRVTWRILTREELEKNFRSRLPEGISRIQMMLTVPKKKRRRAVDRVKMRRRIRESYRLHRDELSPLMDIENLGTISIGFVYIHNENLPYSEVDTKMIEALRRLRKKLLDDKMQ